jgi:hypothetical protein
MFSTNFNPISNTNTNKTSKLLSAIFSLALVFGSLSLLSSPITNAAGTNNADLIIGRVETATAIEMSVCLRNTGDAIKLTDTSTWFNYNNTQLTPAASITATGLYTTPDYNLAWANVSTSGTSETQTLRSTFITGGRSIPNTTDLLAKVTLNKIGTQTNPSVLLTKSTYLTVEYPASPIALNVINQNGDCNTIITTNKANLIIGKVETASTMEITACIVNTGDAIKLTDSSTWFNFDNTMLTANPAITTPGLYTSPDYTLQWANVNTLTTSETWTVNTRYISGGRSIPTTPDLIAKITLNKIGTQTNPAVTLTKDVFLTVEYPTTPIALTVVNQTGACNAVTSTSSSTTTSTSSSTSTSTSSSTSSAGTIGTVSTTTPIAIGTTVGFPTIPLTGTTVPSNSPATVIIPGLTTPITGNIINGQFVPTPGQNLPTSIGNGLIGGILVVPGYQNLPINFNYSNGTTPTTTTTTLGTLVSNIPVTQTVGTPIPSIPFTGSTVPNGTSASLLLPGSSTPILGTIQNGVFIPNNGSTIPSGTIPGLTVGTITTPNAPSVLVPFMVVLPTSSNSGTITILANRNCSPGQFNNIGNCVDCPINAYCEGGLTNGSDVLSKVCPGNGTSPARSTKLTDCVGGSVVTNTPTNSDGTCNPGTKITKDVNGKSSCDSCYAGYICPDGITSKVCSIGTYCPVGSKVEIACPSGRTTAFTGAKILEDCQTIAAIAAAANNGASILSRTGGISIMIGLVVLLGMITFFVLQNGKERRLGDWKK